MMKNEKPNSVEQFKEEQLKNPKVKELYEQEKRRLRLGVALYELRKAARLTQAQLAKKVGVSQAYIAQLETAELENYQIDTLRKVAEALKQDLVVSFRARGKARGAKEFVIAA